jgi:hypothetical protein
MTEEKVRLLRSMGQSAKPEIIKNTLKFVFEGVIFEIFGRFENHLLVIFRIMFECKIHYTVFLVVYQVVMVEI